MKVSKREKGLSAILVLIAIFIFWPVSENSNIVTENLKLTPKYKRVLERFSKIHNLQLVDKSDKTDDITNVKRNIFKYSSPPVKKKTNEELKMEQELAKQIAQKEAIQQQQIEQVEQGPVLPDVDFKIEGIIRTKFGNAIVVSKQPELFVIRENTIFFKKFIFKKVNEDSVVLGFIGFDNEKIIPIEDRGF